MEQINELLEGDRASDVELQKLAQCLVKPGGEAWDEEKVVDIRLAEDLKRRRQAIALLCINLPKVWGIREVSETGSSLLSKCPTCLNGKANLPKWESTFT